MSVDIAENPALGVPAEIAATRDPRTIFTYYFGITAAKESLPLNEFKLVLVGRGGVGKTSLVHRLASGTYTEFESTPGVQITQWSLPIGAEIIRAHVWDFGGQEILHGTHRFFMTARALYLVLISGREGTEDRDAEYWLSQVRSLAGDAPIIVLLHKCDEFRFELRTAELRKRYGDGLLFVETDSKTGKGIDRLEREIRRLAGSLPRLRDAWPVAWWRVKEELPRQKKNWLTFDEFRKFAADRGVRDAGTQESLAESLNALGLMLSYAEDDTLRRFGVLNPQWVTQGIYTMLTAPSLRLKGGVFSLQSFRAILPAAEYPAELHPYLLKLMLRFQLCHPLDEQVDSYLIPELLTKEEPGDVGDFPTERSLGFVYRYDVLPEGLLPRFIVNTYVLHRKSGAVWRTGVVLERRDARAVVRGDFHGATVTIRLSGDSDEHRELLGIIREHFDRIHATYKKLGVTEWVPVPNHPETLVSHERLILHELDRRATITETVGNQLVDLSVEDLLKGADIAGASRLGERESILTAIPLFISYVHEDLRYYDEFRVALKLYERRDEVKIWSDRELVAGDRWDEEISSRIDETSIFVLLLSIHYLASEYAENELQRARRAKASIVPIVVGPCSYAKYIGDLQVVLPNDKPVKEHRTRDKAWVEVTRQLDRVIERIRGKLDDDATRSTDD